MPPLLLFFLLGQFLEPLPPYIEQPPIRGTESFGEKIDRIDRNQQEILRYEQDREFRQFQKQLEHLRPSFEATSEDENEDDSLE